MIPPDTRSDLHVMAVEDAETVWICLLPGLCASAEVKDGGISHHPLLILCSAALELVARILSCIIVPESIIKRQYPAAENSVENVLIRKDQSILMLFDISKNIIRNHFLPASGSINQKHA